MKLAFVIPWFGKGVPGGAESVCFATTLRLHRAGVPVEILTTCVKQLQSDWSKNYHAPGTELLDGMTVRRFPVGPRDTAEFLRINDRLMRRLPVSPTEQATFVREMIRCDELTAFIGNKSMDYVFAFIPYLFSTTYWGVLANPDSSVIIPCLHDEGYAFLDLYRPVFERARGLLFHSRAEMNLANRLFRLRPDAQAVVGAGLDCSCTGDADRFADRFGSSRFILYVGRKDLGKNVPLLIRYFCEYKDGASSDLKLLLMGAGAADIPEEHEHDVIDLGVVSSQEKYDAYAAAIALCQPSTNESFSLVLMEAWAHETPVLVHEDCAATREHCLASSGGLCFSSFEQFAGALDCLVEQPTLAKRLGNSGRRYVLANYTWDRVVNKYLSALANWGFEF
jgi:glycosyltransferase involved in cell wall biosynthesis